MAEVVNEEKQKLGRNKQKRGRNKQKRSGLTLGH
jgi:hypothetical protein